jgi:hypothetical protein
VGRMGRDCLASPQSYRAAGVGRSGRPFVKTVFFAASYPAVSKPRHGPDIASLPLPLARYRIQVAS